MKEIKAILQPHRLEAVLEKSRTQMHSKLILGLAVLFVTSSSFGLSGELSDLEFPESFDRTAYFAAYFSELEDYAKLLEHLYASPKSDTTVKHKGARVVSGYTVS